MTKKISTIDKVASALTYVTAGWFGLFYCIYLYFQKKKISNFVRYNVYQSVFLVLLFFLCCGIFGLMFNILSHIPFIQIIVSWIQLLLLSPILFDRSLFQIFVLIIIVYCVINAIEGKEPRLYWVSKIIDRNIK